MSERDTSGPAFPFEHGHSPDAANVRECGMSYRRYLAGQALHVIAAFTIDHPNATDAELKARAVGAWRAADAILATE